MIGGYNWDEGLRDEGEDSGLCWEDVWTMPIGPGYRRSPELLVALPYPEYLQSPEWQETRRKALGAAGYRCYVCQTSANLHVHHLSYEHVGDERPDELRVLCAECHREVHGIRL